MNHPLMRTKRIARAFLFVLTLATGCHRESLTSLQAGKQNAKIYTEVELEKLIIPGMSEAEVTDRFGTPGSEIKINQGVVLWSYSFPIQPQKEGLHLAGFSIYIKDGNVIKWSPTTEEARHTIQTGGSQGSFGDQTFQIFIANEGLSNVVNTVDSHGIADTDSLKVSPEMTFKAKMFSGNSGSGHPGEQTVILVVSEEDAAKLKGLTETNFGRRLLIVYQNQVIAAPAISAPLASRQLMFTVKDAQVLNRIQGNR